VEVAVKVKGRTIRRLALKAEEDSNIQRAEKVAKSEGKKRQVS
jgi:hypothetical protein